MKEKKNSKKISVEDQLLWFRRARRVNDIKNGVYNARKKDIHLTHKKDKKERRKIDWRDEYTG